MKRRVYFFRFIILTIFFLFVNSSIVFAEETGTEGILESQKNSLNISGFLDEANKYTSDLYGNFDVDDIFNKAIKGEIDNESIIKKFLSRQNLEGLF